MKCKLKFIGMVAVVTIIGLSMSGCPTTSSNDVGGGGISGTWRANIQGMNVTLVVTATGWTFTSPLFTDTGTYTMDGITARLFSNNLRAQVGTAVLLDSNTISVTLNPPSEIRGTFTFRRV